MTSPSVSPPAFRQLRRGDPAPWFKQRSTESPAFTFDTVAGRCILLCFFGSAGLTSGREALDFMLARRQLFDDRRLAFFGVSLDPSDEARGRIAEILPGIRHFLDYDGTVSRAYGSLAMDAAVGGSVTTVQQWVLLDPLLRVIAAIPFAPDGSDRGAILAELDRLPPQPAETGAQAPILLLPDVFEPDLSTRLIAAFDTVGGSESGFMREENGKTVMRHDPSPKRRRDILLEDDGLVAEVQFKIRRRVLPEIVKAYQFRATRMERYLVACYRADEGGHFRPHRDNTTKGTAHRRFAVSINLNGVFSGGELGFPEFGSRSYKAPRGAAVVFSCSLLHMVSPVTSGARYAFLPFLYDEPAAELRERNLVHLEGEAGQ